jgi:hypothetical protein
MSKGIQIFLFSLLINIYISEIYDSNEQILKLRNLQQSTSKNISIPVAQNKIPNIKLGQTVHSTENPQNYYFTTLYIGDNKIKQRYLIDTSSDLMSSTCYPEIGLNPQKNNYIYQNKSISHLKCDSKVCDLLPANICHDEKSKDEKTKNFCAYDSRKNTTEGIKGYYVQDIAYLEEESEYITPFLRKKYHSYAIPIGCSTEEHGKYKNIIVDGVLGMNNSPKSFVGLLYKLKIIKQDMFSLCFGLRGGYMSLGQIDDRHHLEKNINYIPLLDSTNDYLIKINDISIGNDSNHLNINNNTIAQINSAENTTYLPEQIYDKLISKFNEHCAQKENCGKFKNIPELGYCASFPDRETLYNAIYRNWPEISLNLENNVTYLWKPFNYYSYRHPNETRLACLAFTKHNANKIILGTNFFHGHDIIFDRKEKKVGFVKADCSRGNHLWRRSNFNRFYSGNEFEDKDNIRNHGMLKFNRSEDGIDFVRGTNSELNFGTQFKLINYILLSGSIIILIIVAVSVISLLVCNKKVGLKYEEPDVVIEQDIDNDNDN